MLTSSCFCRPGGGQTVIKGDFNSLSKALAEIGIPESYHCDLRAALEADHRAGYTNGMGAKAEGWVTSTIKALGKGALKVGTAVAEKVISTKILEYLGQSGIAI